MRVMRALEQLPGKQDGAGEQLKLQVRGKVFQQQTSAWYEKDAILEDAWCAEAAAMSKSQAGVAVPPKRARVVEIEKQTAETMESIMHKKEEIERVKNEPEICRKDSLTEPIRSGKRKQNVWRESLQRLFS